MSKTLETVLGNTNGIQDDSLLYVGIDRKKVPVITLNFARNVKRGYVVAEIPEKLEQPVLETVVGEEYEKAWFYIEEIKEWNEGQERKREEYELEQEIKLEDARKSSVERILDALEGKKRT